jgi:DNA-binding transcriptional LysR family regulator
MVTRSPSGCLNFPEAAASSKLLSSTRCKTSYVDQLLAHQCLIQGTETWHFVDGDKTIALHPQGRFQADNGMALAAAAVVGLGIAALPDFLTEKELASGALMALMKNYPLTEAGLDIVGAPPCAKGAGPYRIVDRAFWIV